MDDHPSILACISALALACDKMITTVGAIPVTQHTYQKLTIIQNTAHLCMHELEKELVQLLEAGTN